jgi:glycosyltransferase involved in cell wall biosynthesis
MRILELVNTLEVGGAEKMVVSLSLELSARGHEVTVACLRTRGALAARLDEAGVEVIELHKPEGLDWKTVRDLNRHLGARRIDVVHTHNPLVHHYGALAGRLAGVPVIVSTVHGPANIVPLSPSTLLFDAACLLTTSVASCCEAVDAHVRASTLVARRKAVVVPNGIPVERFTALPAKPRNGTFVFGAVGRLVPVKDHAGLIEAFARLRTRTAVCRLDILGGGPLAEALAAQAARCGVQDSVRLMGEALDVPGFLASLDAFVLSSVSEGLPLTVLEAMAAGLPVVGTAVGAVPELLDKAECGWYCAPGNPEALAESMFSCSAAPDLAERGQRARRHVQSIYSVAAMADGYERLFSAALTRG